MRRPPYLRWAAAATVLVVAIGFEVSDRTATQHPFTRRSITAGTPIAADDIDWRAMPSGALPMPDLSSPVAVHDLPAGEPLLPSDVSSSSLVPSGWWSLPLTLPAAAVPGVAVRIVLLDDPGTSVEGIVVAAGASDAFSMADAGLVAVAEAHATTVARAAADDRIMILLRP